MHQNECETPHRQTSINHPTINDKKVISGAQLGPTLLLQIEHGMIPITTDLLMSITKMQNSKECLQEIAKTRGGCELFYKKLGGRVLTKRGNLFILSTKLI